MNRAIPGRAFLRRAAVVTLTGAIALIAAACGGGGHAPDKTDTRPVVAVQLGTALEEEWATGSEVTAGVLPLYRATPGTVLMGRVDRVMVEEGDRVRKGQTLAHIESRDVAAKLAQARAGVAAARAMERNAKSMVDRMARLHSRKAASDKNLEDAEAGPVQGQRDIKTGHYEHTGDEEYAGGEIKL